MSEAVDKQQKAWMGGASSDQHALTQVEKWMATIREISPKPRDEWTVASKALAALCEGATASPEFGNEGG